MILVDSSVWIDYFNGRQTIETDTLDSLLGRQSVLTGDLVLIKVLQGFHEKEYQTAQKLFEALEIRNLAGREIALQAARNFQTLRANDIPLPNITDMIVGTYCIVHTLPLLHSTRDFEIIEQTLGLLVVR